jgi:hypothetical protein
MCFGFFVSVAILKCLKGNVNDPDDDEYIDKRPRERERVRVLFLI